MPETHSSPFVRCLTGLKGPIEFCIQLSPVILFFLVVAEWVISFPLVGLALQAHNSIHSLVLLIPFSVGLFYRLAWPVGIIMRFQKGRGYHAVGWNQEATFAVLSFGFTIMLLVLSHPTSLLWSIPTVLAALIGYGLLISAFAMAISLQWSAARILADGYDASSRPMDATFRMWLLLIFLPLTAYFAKQRLDRVARAPL